MRCFAMMILLGSCGALQAGALVARVETLKTAGGRRFEPTRTLEATQAELPVKTDGRLDERCWKRGRWASRFYKARSRRLSEYPALTKVAFDRQNLYFAFRCPEEQLDKLRVVQTQRDHPKVWADDCVEIYLDANRDGASMFHFMINAAGVVSDKRCIEHPVPDAAAGVPGVYVYRMKREPWDANVRTAASKGDGEWRLEVAIPARDLGLEEIIPGTVMGVTLCRERYTDTARCKGLASLRPNEWAGKIWTYPELRLGEPRVGVACDLPTGVGRNVCRLALKPLGKQAERATVELTARSSVNSTVAKVVELKPGEEAKVELPYVIEGREYDLAVRGKLANGALFLNRRLRGPVEPAATLKVIEFARFAGSPFTRVRVTLGLGAETARSARLALAIHDASGKILAEESVAAPLARGEVEITLKTGALRHEGRCTVRLKVLDQGRELGAATGRLDLVAPPDYGLADRRP